MDMSNEKKKEILLKNFEILKKNYIKNSSALADVVGKMFSVDIETAIDMWIYLINKYEDEVKDNKLDRLNASDLISDIFINGRRYIGETKIEEIVLEHQELKNAFFLMCYSSTIYSSKIISNRIARNDLIVANELLELLYTSKYRKDSWHNIMEESMPLPFMCKLTSDAYELLEMWCDKVDDEEERAELSVKMLGYFD